MPTEMLTRDEQRALHAQPPTTVPEKDELRAAAGRQVKRVRPVTVLFATGADLLRIPTYD